MSEATASAPSSERPVQIIGFDQDHWVTALHHEKLNVRKSFEQYRALSEANLALLKTLTLSSASTTAYTMSEMRRPSKRLSACFWDTIAAADQDAVAG